MPNRKSTNSEASRASTEILVDAVFRNRPRRQHLELMADEAVWKELDHHQSLATLAFQFENIEPGTDAQRRIRQRLKALVIKYAGQQMVWAEGLERIEQALADRSIRFLYLKGWAAAQTVYPQPWMRMMTDVDIFVDPARLDDALDVLHVLGYRNYFPPRGRITRSQYMYAKALKPGVDLVIDLHFRISNHPRYWAVFDFDRVWTDRQQRRGLTRLSDREFLFHANNHASLKGIVDSVFQEMADWFFLCPARPSEPARYLDFLQPKLQQLTDRRRSVTPQLLFGSYNKAKHRVFLDRFSSLPNNRTRFLYLKELVFGGRPRQQ